MAVWEAMGEKPQGQTWVWEEDSGRKRGVKRSKITLITMPGEVRAEQGGH